MIRFGFSCGRAKNPLQVVFKRPVVSAALFSEAWSSSKPSVFSLIAMKSEVIRFQFFSNPSCQIKHFAR